jgi:hypothetical protein
MLLCSCSCEFSKLVELKRHVRYFCSLVLFLFMYQIVDCVKLTWSSFLACFYILFLLYMYFLLVFWYRPSLPCYGMFGFYYFACLFGLACLDFLGCGCMLFRILSKLCVLGKYFSFFLFITLSGFCTNATSNA